MELQQLRYVLTVAETENFTRAAERCHVVQSALSHQVRALEQELGFALFARTSRRVRLTTAGKAFLPAARACLEAAERAIVDAASALGEIRGRLVIGTIPTVSAIDIPAALRSYRQMHPGVRIMLRVEGSEQLAEGVRRSEIDVAVLGLPDHDLPASVKARALAQDSLVAVVSKEHQLARRKRVTLQRLSLETFVDLPAGTPGRAQSDRAFESAGLTRDVAFEFMGTDFMLGLVEANLAVALLPASVASRQRARIAAITVTPAPTRVEHLIWNEFNPSPAAKAFLDILASERIINRP